MYENLARLGTQLIFALLNVGLAVHGRNDNLCLTSRSPSGNSCIVVAKAKAAWLLGSEWF
jgi:hypothetical protein